MSQSLSKTLCSISIDDELAGSIGVSWEGDRNPSGEVTLWVKDSSCSRKITAAAGWHTLIISEEGALHAV